jgi:hypothetical protein
MEEILRNEKAAMELHQVLLRDQRSHLESIEEKHKRYRLQIPVNPLLLILSSLIVAGRWRR